MHDEVAVRVRNGREDLLEDAQPLLADRATVPRSTP